MIVYTTKKPSNQSNSDIGPWYADFMNYLACNVYSSGLIKPVKKEL